MQESAQLTLASWGSFYVIMGSAAAALTGLQFVVIALVKDTQLQTSDATTAAFGTPTIVHFCTVLLVSAMFTAPWHVLSSVAYPLGACGFAGVLYALVIARRATRQTGYIPVLEDWVWHVALPFISYAMMLVASLTLGRFTNVALFFTGAAVLLLLFIGIHNAWDTVTYVITHPAAEKQQGSSHTSP